MIKVLQMFVIMGTVIAGCVAAPNDKNKLNIIPIVDYYPLGGYSERLGELFLVLNGSIDEVKQNLYEIAVNKATPPSVFSTNDSINLVVFRGVFSTGGYGIEIEKVERDRNEFVVHAVFKDAGEGMMVTQAFTQPTAIIPIGRLKAGGYKAVLKVTKIIKEEKKEQIVEEDKEHSSVSFSVK